MDRFVYYVLMACAMGACADEEPNTKCVCKPSMTLQWEPNQHVCNNATFDWLLNTVLAQVSKQSDHIEAYDGELQKVQEQVSVKDQEINDLKWELKNKQEEINRLTQIKQELASHNTKLQEQKDALAIHQAKTHPRPRDCADVMNYGYHYSGIYTIYPAIFPNGMEVFCDLNTDGGGWTVFQRRQDGSTDFDRDWKAYKNGFGKNAKEFWLGNDALHSVTTQRTYEMRVDMTGFDDGKSYFAVYDHFGVGNENENYKLYLGKYVKGDAGDAMKTHAGKPFSTMDNDHDNSKSGNCAELYGGGGWWFDRCYDANLNGIYADKHYYETIVWYTLHKNHEPMKYVEMKFRPVGFGKELY